MTRTEQLKKHLPWYAVVGGVLTTIALVYNFKFAPWLPKAEAATKVEVTSLEEQQNKVHEAFIRRIEGDKKELKKQMTDSNTAVIKILDELKEDNQVLRQRTYNIVQKLPRSPK